LSLRPVAVARQRRRQRLHGAGRVGHAGTAMANSRCRSRSSRARTIRVATPRAILPPPHAVPASEITVVPGPRPHDALRGA
jgi:hypothetical protein